MKNLPKELKNLNLVLNEFEKRKLSINDYSGKVNRLKTIILAKEHQLSNNLPKVK